MAAPPSVKLSGVRAKIERANQHIGDLEARICAFRGENPYRVVPEADPNSGHRQYIVRVHSTPPLALGLVAGEAVHQLRSSLDHLAWQLVEANGGVPGKNTYFPILKDAPTTDKAKQRFADKVKGM